MGRVGFSDVSLKPSVERECASWRLRLAALRHLTWLPPDLREKEGRMWGRRG